MLGAVSHVLHSSKLEEKQFTVRQLFASKKKILPDIFSHIFQQLKIILKKPLRADLL
jgi:hypothetical protein